MGYSRTVPADGGGVPPCHLSNYWMTVDPKTALDSSGLELSEYVAKCYLNVTGDVTGPVKGQNFDYTPLLAAPSKAAISD